MSYKVYQKNYPDYGSGLKATSEIVFNTLGKNYSFDPSTAILTKYISRRIRFRSKY